MNIAIVDDQKEFLDIIGKRLFDIDYDVYSFTSVFDMEKTGVLFDLVLLDIDMPDYDGIEYAKNHKSLNVVFITSREDRVKDAFGNNVYGFISKDDKKQRYRNVIEEALQQIENQKIITLKCNGDIIRFAEKDIVYLMYIGRKTISLVYQQKTYTIRGYSLKEIEEKLGEQFIQINKAVIVNLAMILRMNNDQLYLIGIGQSFTVSRRRKDFIRKYIENKGGK